MERMISDALETLIGDTPVSVQLATALYGMSSKEDVNALRQDVNELRKEIEKLIGLVGDIPVSEQINMVISKSEN